MEPEMELFKSLGKGPLFRKKKEREREKRNKERQKGRNEGRSLPPAPSPCPFPLPLSPWAPWKIELEEGVGKSQGKMWDICPTLPKAHNHWVPCRKGTEQTKNDFIETVEQNTLFSGREMERIHLLNEKYHWCGFQISVQHVNLCHDNDCQRETWLIFTVWIRKESGSVWHYTVWPKKTIETHLRLRYRWVEMTTRAPMARRHQISLLCDTKEVQCLRWDLCSHRKKTTKEKYLAFRGDSKFSQTSPISISHSVLSCGGNKWLKKSAFRSVE